MNKMGRRILVIVSSILALIILLIMMKYGFNHKSMFTNVEQFKTMVNSYGSFSFLVFLFIQIIQIVFFFIPGEVVQVAGGYIFGPYVSFLLCIIGAIIGSAAAFLITRKLGKPFLQKICGKNNLWLVKKLDKNKMGERKGRDPRKLIFILYLIPGIPKDLLAYICGVADISLKEFLIISTIGRAPALFFSCMFGDQVSTKNWTYIIFLTAIFILIFGALFLVTRKHINKIKREAEREG